MSVLLILSTHIAATKGPLQLEKHEQSYKNAANTAHDNDSKREWERGDGGCNVCLCLCTCVYVRVFLWCMHVCGCVCVCYRQTADHSLKNAFNIKHQHANDNWANRPSLHCQNKQQESDFVTAQNERKNGAGTPQGDYSRQFILIKERTSPVLSPSAIHSMIKWSGGVRGFSLVCTPRGRAWSIHFCPILVHKNRPKDSLQDDMHSIE